VLTHREQDFLDQLASAKPTPAGGSAAAYTAALAAALVGMVARLTVGKKKYEAVQNRMQFVIEQSDEWRDQLSMLVTLDAEAFENFIAARKLLKKTPGDKEYNYAFNHAAYHAAETPLKVATLALQVLETALEVARDGNFNTIFDAGTAAALAQAAIQSTSNNIKINLFGLDDERAMQMLTKIDQISEQAAGVYEKMQEVLQERGRV
jgi:formiminotetrahydrofolate cyclodeaminase